MDCNYDSDSEFPILRRPFTGAPASATQPTTHSKNDFVACRGPPNMFLPGSAVITQSNSVTGVTRYWLPADCTPEFAHDSWKILSPSGEMELSYDDPSNNGEDNIVKSVYYGAHGVIEGFPPQPISAEDVYILVSPQPTEHEELWDILPWKGDKSSVRLNSVVLPGAYKDLDAAVEGTKPIGSAKVWFEFQHGVPLISGKSSKSNSTRGERGPEQKSNARSSNRRRA